MKLVENIIEDLGAKNYKMHGYTHVCIRREYATPACLVGFKGYYQ